MKKLILGAAIVLALGAASCNHAPSGNTEAGITPYTDSLSRAFGSYVGASVAMQCQDYTQEQKEQFMRAFQTVMTSASNEYELHGAVVAAQLLQSMEQFDQRGLSVAKTPIVAGFRKTFALDSVDYATVMSLSEEFRQLHESGVTRVAAERAQQAMNSPEAQQNGRVAEAYVNRLKENDPSVQTTESGLTYKITEPGNATHPTANSTVKVKYVGKHLNGETFDQSGDTPATFNLRGVVPGFSEGIQLLGQGGKATLYIPGKLAYGPEGQQQASIGPNEMLVFEVELVEIQ